MRLAELLKVRSRQEHRQRLLELIARDPVLRGFPVTDWHEGGAGRTLIELQAQGLSDEDRVIADTARAGFLSYARGAWLDELVESHYGIQRKPSGFARGLLTLTAEAGMGPYNIPAGGLWAETVGGLRYNSLAPVTVPREGGATVLVQAEGSGSAYNVPSGTVTRLVTPLPGLRVDNAAEWLTVAGADVETDAQLSRRAGLRWAELGGGAVRAAYEYWALTAHPAVTQVAVHDEHPRGQGTVDVVLWGEGGIGDEVVAEVDSFVQHRRPLTANVLVYSAAPVEVPLVLQLYAPGQDRESIATQVEANLAELQRTTGIGGIVYRADFIKAAMLPAGVEDAVLTLPVRDARLQYNEAAILRPVLTWRETP